MALCSGDSESFIYKEEEEIKRSRPEFLCISFTNKVRLSLSSASTQRSIISASPHSVEERKAIQLMEMCFQAKQHDFLLLWF